MSPAVVFFKLLLSSISAIKITSPLATVAEVACVGATNKVDENAPEVAVAPPDNPEVEPVVIVTPVISPSPM